MKAIYLLLVFFISCNAIKIKPTNNFSLKIENLRPEELTIKTAKIGKVLSITLKNDLKQNYEIDIMCSNGAVYSNPSRIMLNAKKQESFKIFNSFSEENKPIRTYIYLNIKEQNKPICQKTIVLLFGE